MIRKVIWLGCFVVLIFGCDSARMSDANFKGNNQGPNEKLECTPEKIYSLLVSTVDVEVQGDDELWHRLSPFASLTPFSGSIDPKANYGYRNLAAHPVNGPEVEDQKLIHFSYQFKGETYLYFVFKNYKEALNQTDVEIQISVRGNQLKDEVILSDEPFEIGRDVDTGLRETYYYAHFRFQQFTDGAVIGPFTGLDWQVLVDYKLSPDTEIEKAQFADSLLKPQNFSQQQTTQFLIRPTKIKACNLPQ